MIARAHTCNTRILLAPTADSVTGRDGVTDYSSTTVQYVLYFSMIVLTCILNTRADQRQRRRTSTDLSRTYASGEAPPPN